MYPTEFIPERWTTRPDLILNKSVFIPFNIGMVLRPARYPVSSNECLTYRTGPYACVGKRLALIEIRRVVAEVLTRYDVRAAPFLNKEAFVDGKQDTFTLVSAPLPLIFTPRCA